MIIPNESPASGEPSSSRVRSARRRSVTVVAMVALATTFIFASAPAPAAIAAPVSMNNHTSYAAGGPNGDCRGRFDSDCEGPPECRWPCISYCDDCYAPDRYRRTR